MLRSAALAALLPLAALDLAGCSTTSGSCTDYIGLPTPQARFDASSTVVVATVEGTRSTVEPDAIYPVFRAHVIEVEKGDPHATDFDLYNPSDQCITRGEPAQYVESDRLSSAHRVLLYLSPGSVGRVRSLVAPNALDALPAGSALPFSTASPTPSGSAG